MLLPGNPGPSKRIGQKMTTTAYIPATYVQRHKRDI